MKYLFVISSCFCLLSCNTPSSGNKIGNEIAASNGAENFKKTEMLEFIFNVQHDTAAASNRHWQWYPKKNEVVFISDTLTTRFKRNDTTTQQLKKLNARFTNDEYWLLFPYHLGWDNGFNVSDSGMKVSPISNKNMRKVTAKYNNTDGYTPGDLYEAYVDENNRIQEWAYHKSGANAPSLVTTWENYKDFNGLQLAQDHKSKNGQFHIWFTGIQVK